MKMETLKARGTIGEDGILRLEIKTHRFHEENVDVIIVVAAEEKVLTDAERTARQQAHHEWVEATAGSLADMPIEEPYDPPIIPPEVVAKR